MSFEFYLAYVLACIAIVILPGPTVSLIVANSITHGTRAGLINIAGTQLGLAVMIAIVLIGLASLIETVGVWFDWVRLAGAGLSDLAWIQISARAAGRWVTQPRSRRRGSDFSGKAFWC